MSIPGESAGRARGNPPRASARRRMSDDERAERTHQRDDPDQWPDEMGSPTAAVRRWTLDLAAGVFYALLTLLLLAGVQFGGPVVGRCSVGLLVSLVVLLGLVVNRRAHQGSERL